VGERPWIEACEGSFVIGQAPPGSGVRPSPPYASGSFAIRRSAGPTRAETWFFVAVVFAHVYYFHRYAFKYSDTGTSPTYANTPRSWQMGKYVALGGLTLVCYGSLWARRLTAPSGPQIRAFSAALRVFFVGCLLATLAELVVGSQAAAEQMPKAWFFLPLVLAIPRFFRPGATIERAARIGVCLVVYHVLFSAYQLYAFRHGRLPGLAYPNGGLVRFGGGLDDPNGFGIFLVLPLVLVVASWAPRRLNLGRISVLAVLGYLLLRTLSYSSFLALIVALAAYCAISRKVGPALVGILSLLGGLYYAVLHVGAITRVVNFKAASVASRFHLGGSTAAGDKSFWDYLQLGGVRGFFLGNAGQAPHSENSYVSAAFQFGVPVTLLLIALLLAVIRQGLRQHRSLRWAGQDQRARVVAALTAYEIAFVVGAAGVPFLQVFPVNFTFWAIAVALWLPLDSVGGDVAKRSREPSFVGGARAPVSSGRPSRDRS
jgi:hypothetical protein